MNIRQALEIMKTHVVTADIESTIADAVDRMDLYQVDELPIVDTDGKLWGMLNEKDIAKVVARKYGAALTGGLPPESVLSSEIGCIPIRSILVSGCPCVTDTDVITRDLVNSLLQHHRRIPVTDECGKLVGTLNRVDIIQAIIEKTIQFE